jgi:pimeloyl-ACP methyl ester carboxylesterase
MVNQLPQPELYVEELGRGSPVVLLHGFPGNASDLRGVAEHLARNHRVLIPDLLGFGRSPSASIFAGLWVPAQVDALVAALDVRGINRAAFVGHDYGGPIALTLLARLPERVSHLVLSSTNVFTDTPVDPPLNMLLWPVAGRLLEPLIFSGISLRMLGRMATSGKRPASNSASEVRAIRTIFATVLRDLPGLYGPIQASLGRIRVPTRVIWGDRDPFFRVAQGERTAAAIPGADLRLYAGVGHFAPLERPDIYASDVEELLAR